MKTQAEKILKDRPHMDDNHAALAIAQATGETYEKVAKYLGTRKQVHAVAKIANCTLTEAAKLVGVWQ
jgi:tetrahydromethanopterin S-methyltransferase subunit H